jgi:hypothetical protein
VIAHLLLSFGHETQAPSIACQACQRQGTQWYEQTDAGHFDKVYLQDRATDTIVEKTPPV